VTNRFVVQSVCQREYSVCGIKAEHGAGPARPDGVSRPRRRCLVTDNGDERLDAADCDARQSVLYNVEHVERYGELDETVVIRLIKTDVEHDAGAMQAITGSDTQRVDRRRRTVESTCHL